MKITFGISVAPNCNYKWLTNSINSIINQANNNFEIIIIGGNLNQEKDEWSLHPIKFIDFDEWSKPAWITKKKNIIAQEAKYENLVIIHDYFKFADGWLKGAEAWDKFHPGWQVMMNRVENLEGTRHGDWAVHPWRMQEVIDTNPSFYTEMLMKVAPHENAAKYVAGLPYAVNDLSHIQYISGGYIFCKTNILRRFPFDENRTWGQEEDIEWSDRLNKEGILFDFNPYSITTIQKPSKWYMSQMPYSFVETLRNYYGSK